MFTALFVPLLAKDIEIPYDESHTDFLKDDLLIIEFQEEIPSKDGKKYETRTDYARFIQTQKNRTANFDDKAKIVRTADTEDKKRILENTDTAKSYQVIVVENIQKEKLAMSLAGIQISMKQDMVLVTFTAEQRIDFRNLLRELSQRFKKRTQLLQIGARDRAKIVGGKGICGLKLCCSNHLRPIPSVTMDAARDQNIAFKGAEGLSGVCGKLKCCLNYESKQYKELKKIFPKFGSSHTLDGINYVIIGMDILNGKLKLKSQNDFVTMDLEEFKTKKK